MSSNQYQGPVIEVHFGKYVAGSSLAKRFAGDGPFVVGDVIPVQKGSVDHLTMVKIAECFVALSKGCKTWVLVVADATEA